VKIPRLRSWPTVLSGLILFLGVGFIVLTSLFLSPLLGLSYPERGLARVAERTVRLREAVQRVPSWERPLHAFCDPSLGTQEELSQLLEWHRELVRLSKNPAVLYNLPVIMTHAGVLEGESGWLEVLDKQTRNWLARAPHPVPLYGLLLRAAYFEEPAPQHWAGLLHELLPPDGLRDRLEERIAHKNGEPTRADAIRKAEHQAGLRILWRYRLLTALDLALLVLFGAAGILFFSRSPEFWRAGPASVPLPWPAPAGMAVLVRGCALGILLTLAFAFLPFASHPAWMPFSYLLWTLPILWLAQRALLRPNHLTLRQELGLAVPLKQWGKLLLFAALGLGADSLGGWLIGSAGSFLRLPNHWAESFDADLVFGAPVAFWSSLAGIVFVGPFFEELIFRGFLYGTLRGRLGMSAALAVSAGIFSMVHGYGAVGFLTVFWSGVVFAWVYEKSGSLWPAIAAHGAGNLLYSLNVIAMLRMS